jgi:hypothetical protein
MEILTILANSGSSTYLEAPVNLRNCELEFIHKLLLFSSLKNSAVVPLGDLVFIHFTHLPRENQLL